MKLTAVDIHGNIHEVDASEVSWRVHAYGVVVKEGKILLSPQHNGYDLPGGTMEINESLEKALVREVREETGLDVEVGRLLEAKDNVFKITWREPRDVWHSVMLYYVCKVIGGEISTDGFDKDEQTYARAAEWVPLEKLESIVPAASYDWREVVKGVLHGD